MTATTDKEPPVQDGLENLLRWKCTAFYDGKPFYQGNKANDTDFVRLSDVRSALSKPPTTWEAYAARLAPLVSLDEWWLCQNRSGMTFICEKSPFHYGATVWDERGLWPTGDVKSYTFPCSFICNDWRNSLLRITRTPEGVSVAAVTDGRGA